MVLPKFVIFMCYSTFILLHTIITPSSSSKQHHLLLFFFLRCSERFIIIINDWWRDIRRNESQKKKKKKKLFYEGELVSFYIFFYFYPFCTANILINKLITPWIPIVPYTELVYGFVRFIGFVLLLFVWAILLAYICCRRYCGSYLLNQFLCNCF